MQLGVFNRGDTQEPGEVLALVEETVVNDNFDPNTLEYDIAMVKLAGPVQFTDHISPICLPHSDAGVINSEHLAWVTGWGEFILTCCVLMRLMFRKIK